ncbi:MAG TPA: CDP-glycerol glycerophosphotransferase family protein [Ilumatobacteraceae bacterium]|nr:CDP-glycerol glycerophosphotransferase family protein [Ilumatobacteraceae bacterium]
MEDVLITRTSRVGETPLRTGLRRLGRERLGVYRGMFVKRMSQWPLRATFRSLSRFVHRDSDLVVFGSVRNRFADNSAYLFLHMACDTDLRCVWISGSHAVVKKLRQAGFDARHRWSIDGLRAAFRAGFYVYCFAPSDINLWLSDGAATLNLWHGLGVKRIERDRGAPWDRMYNASDHSITGQVFADDRRPPNWLVAPSPQMRQYFARPFDLPIERCIEFGYPRNDHLVKRTRPPASLIDASLYDRLERHDLVVGFFPTWRYDSFEALPEGSPTLDDIARIVGQQGGVVLFKPHHQSATPAASDPAIVMLPAECDLNAYLGLCHVLVTDYSSVAADFLLLDRPIVVWGPDVDQGIAMHQFSVDPLTMQPGLLVRTKDELFSVLSDARSIPPAANFDDLREHYWGSVNAESADALREFVKSTALIHSVARK